MPSNLCRGVWALLTLATLAGAVGCDRLSELTGASKKAAKGADGPKPPVPITVAEVRSETLQRTVTAVGTLFPDEEVVIRAEVAGKVSEISADAGQTLAPNRPLAKLEPDNYQQRVEQATHSLAETLAQLGLTDVAGLTGLDVRRLPTVVAADAAARQVGADLEDAAAAVRVAQAEVDGAVASLANAETKFREAERNFRANAATPEEVADKRTLRDAAAATLAAVRGRVAVSQAKLQSVKARAEQAAALRDVELNKAAALVSEARRKQSLLLAANTDLERTRILTPTSRPPPMSDAARAFLGELDAAGRRYLVTRRRVSVGDFAEVGDELFRLVITHPLKLRALVPERFDAQVQPGQKVELTVASFPQRPFVGVVSHKNVVDPTNRTFETEVVVPNQQPDRTLNPGSFAKAEIFTHRQTGVLMVPQEAIVSFAGVVKLFVIDGPADKLTAREMQVELGVSRVLDGQRWVEVRPNLSAAGVTAESLRPGLRVAISGTSRLSNGRSAVLKTEKPARATKPTGGSS